MNNKNTKRFRIIPFCISALLVLFITVGIGVYTTFYYGGTDVKFLDKYLGYEKNTNIYDSKEYIEKFVEISNNEYMLNSKETGLNFRNPVTKEIYSDVANTEVSKENLDTTNYFQNGVMHVKGYFKLALYTFVNENENSDGEKELTVSYGFYFYDIDYANLKTNKPTFYVTFVEGVDSRTSLDEYEENETPKGDLALQYALEKTFTSGIIPTNEGYAYNKKGYEDSILHYNTYDIKGNVENTDYKVNSTANPLLVQKAQLTNFSPISYEDKNGNSKSIESKYFSDIDSATFAIYMLETDKNGEEKPNVLVEGTLNNVLDEEEVKEMNLQKGLGEQLYKSSSFVKYTWSTILLYTGIAFAVSFILASLFYLLWVDDKQPKNKKVKK